MVQMSRELWHPLGNSLKDQLFYERPTDDFLVQGKHRKGNADQGTFSRRFACSADQRQSLPSMSIS
jgi:hypothetical protein